MTAPVFTVREVRLYEREVRLRLPFRFGVVTLTEAPQVFVRVRIELADGSSHWGAAAELLAQAEESGVTFVKGADFFPGGSGGERSARLAFSYVSPDEISDGIGRLAALLRAAAPPAL